MNTTQVMHEFAPGNIVMMVAHKRLMTSYGQPKLMVVGEVVVTLGYNGARVSYRCRALSSEDHGWSSLGKEACNKRQNFCHAEPNKNGYFEFPAGELMAYEPEEEVKS